MVTMMQKRAWLRLVEASLAAILVTGMLFVVAESQKVKSSDDAFVSLPALLDEIAKDPVLRQGILDGTKSSVDVKARLDTYFSTRDPTVRTFVLICNAADACQPAAGALPADEDMSVAERIISTPLQSASFTPKKMRAFFWRIQ